MPDNLEYLYDEWKYTESGWQHLVAVYWDHDRQRYVIIPYD